MIDLEDVLGMDKPQQIGPRAVMVVRSATGVPFAMGVSAVENHEELVIRHLMRMQPESERAILDLSWPQHFFIGRARHVPTMVVGAEADAFFTPTMIHSTALVYGVAAEFFPDTAHAMMLERDWQRVADRIMEWLATAIAA